MLVYLIAARPRDSEQMKSPNSSTSDKKQPTLSPESINTQFNIPGIFDVREKNAREEYNL